MFDRPMRTAQLNEAKAESSSDGLEDIGHPVLCVDPTQVSELHADA
jgi:hypothetical protein